MMDDLIGKHVLINIADHSSTLIEIEGIVIDNKVFIHRMYYVIKPLIDTEDFPNGLPKVYRELENILEIWEP